MPFVLKITRTKRSADVGLHVVVFNFLVALTSFRQVTKLATRLAHKKPFIFITCYQEHMIGKMHKQLS